MGQLLQLVEYMGVILVLTVYSITLYYIDKKFTAEKEALLVGLNGRVFPLEELLECSRKHVVGNRVDPLLIESKCTRRDVSLGLTTKYTSITAILLGLPLISYILWRNTVPAITSSIILLAVNITLYTIYKSIQVEASISKTGRGYQIAITVSSPYPVRILVIDNPPPGIIVGDTKSESTKSCTLTYHWIPITPGKYSWSPGLILVEDPLGLVRIDFSSKVRVSIRVRETVIQHRIENPSTGQTPSYPTIREPVVDKVRGYSIGDNLRDLVPRSLLSPSGLAVKEYEKFYEGPGKGRLDLVLLGVLAIRNKEYLLKLVSYALAGSSNKAIGLLIEGSDNVVILDSRLLEDLVTKGLEVIRTVNKSLKLGEVLDRIDRVFTDPSIRTVPATLRDKLIIVLPYDWRLTMLESYKAMVEELVEKIRNSLGDVVVAY